MNSQQIEQTAINKLKDRLNLTKYLSPYIDVNDKTPIWDGAIYIYNSERRDNDSFIGRMPVQVKGHEEDDLSKDEISYNLELSVVRGFHRDGGVILFIIYLTPNEDCSDFKYRVYYDELLPDKLSAIISGCSANQKTVTVHLRTIPKNSDDFASLVLNCYQNHKKQTSFAGAELKTIEELSREGVVEGIQFFVNGFGEEYRGIRGFVKLNTPPYVLIKGAAIPQPVKYQGDIVYKIATTVLYKKVHSNGKVFYTQYKVIEKPEGSYINIGSSFVLTILDDGQRMQFSYKASTKLRQFVSDLPFMIAFAETKEFSIDDNIFDFSENESYFSSFDIAFHKGLYQTLSRYVETMNILGCSEDLDFATLTDEDWQNLEMLTRAILERKTIDGSQYDLPATRTITINNIRLAVSIIPIEGNPKVCLLCHPQDRRDVSWYNPDLNEVIPIPACAVFGVRDYVLLSNIRFDRILSEIKDFPVNQHLYEIANDIMLRMIVASDEATDERKQLLLKTSADVADWLMTLPESVWDKRVAVLNKIQINRRRQSLSKEDKGELMAMIELSQDREDVLFGANALLDNKEEALRHFEALPFSMQKEIKQYPIYRFVDEGFGG